MSKYKDCTYAHIGLSVDSDSLEDTKEVIPMSEYAEFDFPQLSKANSFLLIEEQFYIGKKQPSGKKGNIYYVYRVSDKRYICPSVLSKEDTIKMVTNIYMEYV